VHNSDLWIDIRAANEQLSELSLHLRQAALEARRTAQSQQEQDSQLHLELLHNLKQLADRVRDILWRELQDAARNPAERAESQRRAAELFALLAKIGEARQGAGPTTFFEQIEAVVDRALEAANPPNPPDTNHTSHPKAA
jgi:hypothetical protein